MKIINNISKQIICSNVLVVNSFIQSLTGLIGQTNIQSGLLFRNLNFGIHTFGMKEPIDVLLVNKDNEIIKIKENLQPFKVFFYLIPNVDLLELPKNSISKSFTKIGDIISYSN